MNRFCDFGTCKRRPRVCVSMLDMKTRETSKTHVCGNHLCAVLSGCERTNKLANIINLPRTLKTRGKGTTHWHECSACGKPCDPVKP